jgi:predicted  nucleic acid-binding Zn-ribbon protein
MNYRYAWIMIFLLPIASCDDPKKIQQSKEQKQEIARLQGELEYLNEKLQAIPRDRSQELENIKKQLDLKALELSEVTAKVTRARDAFLQAKDDLQRFRNSHPLP